MKHYIQTSRAVIAALLACTALPVAAQQTVINFDVDGSNAPIANGTSITNQYAGSGVTFEGFENGVSTPIVATTAGGSFSGPNAMTNCNNAFCSDRADVMRLTFSGAASNIGFQLDSFGGNTITFELYDEAGTMIETQAFTVNSFQAVSFTSSGVRRIDGLQPSESWAWGLDDLTFTLGPIAPKGPTTSEEIATLIAASSTSGILLNRVANVIIRDQAQSGGASRNQQLDFTRVPSTGSDVEVTMSSQNAPGMMGNLYTWIEISGIRAEDDSRNRDVTGRGLQIGADMEVAPDMVLGLSLGVQDIDSSAPGVSQEGTLRFVQPYLSYRAGNWQGTATLMFGRGDYTQVSAGGTGTADTELRAFSFTGGYDIAMDGGWTATPTLGLGFGQEETTGTGGTLAGAGSQTVNFREASLGARMTRAMGTGTLFAGLHADWLDTEADTALVTGLLSDDGWTGRIELGGSTTLDNGLDLDIGVEIGGLGGDLRSTSAALSAALRF